MLTSNMRAKIAFMRDWFQIILENDKRVKDWIKSCLHYLFNSIFNIVETKMLDLLECKDNPSCHWSKFFYVLQWSWFSFAHLYSSQKLSTLIFVGKEKLFSFQEQVQWFFSKYSNWTVLNYIFPYSFYPL